MTEEVYKINWKKNRHDRGEKTINGNWEEAYNFVKRKLEEGYRVFVNNKRRELKDGFISPSF